MKSYKTVKNESVVFDGNFSDKISVIKPKKLPQLQRISRPKTSSEEALMWAQTLIHAVNMMTGSYFNYKMADSSNKYNSKNIAS